MPPSPPQKRPGRLKKPPSKVKDISGDLAYFLQRGDELRREGSYYEAIQVLDRALLLEKSARALAARASAKRALLQREAAVNDYTAALKLEPTGAVYLSSRGVVKSELGWYRDAQEDFQQALKLDSMDKVAKWGLQWVKQQESHAPLRVVLLNGFQRMSAMNTTYLERRNPECIILGRESYWSLDNQHVIYWSSQERRWKGCRAVDVQRISTKASPGCIGAPERMHLLSPSLQRGWFEWNGKNWEKIPISGVTSFGPVTAPLRIVALKGFWRAAVNTSYVERRHLEFTVNGRETYWSCDGSLFIYWCPKESRWRGSRAQDLLKVQKGESVALFGAPRSNDILSFKTGWHELQKKEWVVGSAGANIEAKSLRKRTVKLVGFSVDGVNGVYRENRQKEFMVNNREIYIQPGPGPDGGHFLYWSKAESRWKGTVFSNLKRIQGGRQSAIIGAPQLADIFDPALLRGWHEWTGDDWVYRSSAGVGGMGTVRDDPVTREKAPEGAQGNKRKREETPPPAPASQTRERLIQDVFKHFDKNGDQLLSAPEMLSFASSVGFDGSYDEWLEEYRLICEGLGRTVEQCIDAASFLKLVNEDTDDGCYCSDKELAGMLGQS